MPEMVSLEQSVPLRESKCGPYKGQHFRSNCLPQYYRQFSFRNIALFSVFHPCADLLPPSLRASVLYPGPWTVLCLPNPVSFFFHSPHMCLLPSLSLVTNNVHSWWKAQLCGNPWQRNVSICQAWVMPGSVAWLLSVVSLGPGLKVLVSTSHTPMGAGLHLWSFARPPTITTSEALVTCKLLHLSSLDAHDTLFFLSMLQWKTACIVS